MARFTSIALGNTNNKKNRGKKNKKNKKIKSIEKHASHSNDEDDHVSLLVQNPSSSEDMRQVNAINGINGQNKSLDVSNADDCNDNHSSSNVSQSDACDTFNTDESDDENILNLGSEMVHVEETATEDIDELESKKNIAKNTEILSSIRNQMNMAPIGQTSGEPISFGDSFESLAQYLAPEILKHVTETLGFTRMTPIQQSCIPLLLSNKDIVAEAVTGSGKTLAYLIPMIQVIHHYEQQRLGKLIEAKKLDDDVEISRKIRGVIICPTRELTKQVYEIAQGFESAVSELQVLLVTGGVERNTDFDNYSLIVATPGRLLELMMKKNIINLDLSHVEFLVLDEADKILELGFDTQVNAILKDLPSQRRTALYSATQTRDMYKWIKAGLRNPVRVAVKVKRKDTQRAQATPLQLKNYYMVCGYDARFNQLVHLLEQYKDMKIIVYFYTCAIVEYFYLAIGRLMKAKEIDLPKCFMLHGQLKANTRKKVLESFRDAEKGVLFSTDVTSRGIDLPNITFIIQFDPPRDPASYVHRAGRSARMGTYGSSLLFLSPTEDAFADYLRRKKIPLEEMPPNMDTKNLIEIIREMAPKDRELFEKSEEALKSFARTYKEHELSYIFDKKKVSYDDLCVGYGLIRKPPIDQLKTHKFIKFKWDGSINVEAIPYIKSDQEKARKKRLHEARKQAKLEEKMKRMEEEGLLNSSKELATVTSFKQMRTDLRADRSIRTRNKKQMYQQIIADEINYEKQLLKKVNKKKISEKDYERLTGETYFKDRIEGFTVNLEDAKQEKKEKGKESKKRKRKNVTMTAEERAILKRLKISDDLL